MPKQIEIYIDRIVLEGYDHLNKAELSIAVQEQLRSAISEQGLPNGLMNRSYHRKLNGGQMNLETRPKTQQLGSDIASGIYKGIQSVE